MTQNVSDIDHPPAVFDRRDQPALVVAYVEDHKLIDYVRPSPAIPDIGKARPIRVLRNLVPRIERRAPLFMFRRRVPNRFTAHDPHCRIFAFCEVTVNLHRLPGGEDHVSRWRQRGLER